MSTGKQFEYIVRFLARTMPFWSREFLCSYICKIHTSIELAFVTQSQYKLFSSTCNQDVVMSILQSHSNLLKRYYESSEAAKIAFMFNLKVGMSLLSCESD